MNTKRLLYVAGPTASGKTTLAIGLAQHYQTEIISCDSRQFYKEMKIGTAVPSSEELSTVPHHFIQQKSIHNPYNIGTFQKEALSCLETLFKTHNTVVMVGGSGLYADAVMQGLDTFPKVDPKIRTQLNTQLAEEGITPLQQHLKAQDPVYYARVDIKNPRRLIRALEICLSSGKPYSSFLGNKQAPNFFNSKILSIQWDRTQLYNRINKRVDQMVHQGLENEARSLYPHKDNVALQTVGYSEWFSCFDGTFDSKTAIEEIKKNSRRYAKRQITWFQKYSNALHLKGGSTTEQVLKLL